MEYLQKPLHSNGTQTRAAYAVTVLPTASAGGISKLQG